jgi:tungstate transport system ATP-binding protein
MIPAYQLRDVHFFYGEKTALSLSELTIETGKVTALIGPNGCGKSTLLNLLACLDMPAAGEINCLGARIEPKRLFAIRKRIGLLPQKPYMLRGTVLDNLKLALRLHGTPKHCWQKSSKAVLERLAISHLAAQQATSLSGGELQKAALARALITQPDVLLLDEPFSYLDQDSSYLLERFIASYLEDQQGTLIFSTHNRLQGLALADEVISLVQGELIKSPLINLFHGQTAQHIFDTGNIKIMLTGDVSSCRHVSIDPHEIVLSRLPLISSIRNQFQGRVTTIAEEVGKVRVAVNAGEIFQVLITYEAFIDLQLNLGDALWVSFKSNSVVAF